MGHSPPIGGKYHRCLIVAQGQVLQHLLNTGKADVSYQNANNLGIVKDRQIDSHCRIYPLMGKIYIRGYSVSLSRYLKTIGGQNIFQGNIFSVGDLFTG